MTDDTATDTPAGGFACPIPASGAGHQVTLAHGEGGRQMRRLIEDRILPRLVRPGSDAILARLADAACLPPMAGRLAFTTDSFVVTPLFFPGGDIGELAVYGTVNDLAVSGAIPRWLSLSFIVEEGFDLAILERILDSIARAAERTAIEIVTGDTKVVPRGAADGLFINTSGLGELVEPGMPGPSAIEPGDVLLVSGPIGRHGLAVLAARESLGLFPEPTSDCAPLVESMAALREARVTPRTVRDATRGGVATVCHEWAGQSGQTLTLEERLLPTTPVMRGACELLGLDPLFLANEGTLVAAVPPEQAELAVTALRRCDVSREAAIIGTVIPRGVAKVTVRGTLGVARPLDELPGMLLPRIC